MTDNIKVIVRVRPFNSNQEGQANVVQMQGQQVRLKDIDTNEYKKFAFHRCYWSIDNSLGKPPVDNAYVFNDIGKQVLQHIYQGYNSTIFAYGQTGSGKSYSIQGYQQKGLLQMCLQDIFRKKQKIQSQANGLALSVKVTYLQIYNQKLRDLLDPRTDKQITIQSAQNMIFIKGTDPIHCNSYKEVQQLWKDGKKIRVIGAHAMNKNSSRSHAVFTINYTQTGNGKSIKAKFNIVDLAGSQRQSKTGATGVRLQEANNINKSLTNLGIVIEALAKNCEKKSKDAFVPYRNSLLTHVLSESLGGNSKTFMIAAISPAESNFQQTLSTLRFAQRASLISTQTKKNVQSKQVYNKQLLEEIQRLKNQLQDAKNKPGQHTHSVDLQYIQLEDDSKAKLLQQRMAKMISELQINKTAMQQLQKQLQDQRLKKIEMQKNRQKALKEAGLSSQTNVKIQDLKLPYIMNISQDPTLAGMLIYHLKEGSTSIGTKDEEQNDIKLNSLGINKRHCTIINQKGNIYIIPKSQAKLFVNGQMITQKRQLNHLDRIVLGHANTFKLIIPGQKVMDDLRQSVTGGGKYGQLLDDRLSVNTPEAKNTKIFLQELQLRLGKMQFSKFLDKFKTYFTDIDEANDITLFRYKKFPIKTRCLHFKLNVIVNIQKYMKEVPQLIIMCENKSSKQIEFIWTEQKFQARLAEMQDWYADVSGKASQNTYLQFDPWFDATDQFIKQKQKIETLKTKQLFEFWENKQKQNNEKYKQCLKLQGQILKQFKPFGIDDLVLESYGDSQKRGEDIFISQHIPKIKKIKQNSQWQKKAEIYTENVLQSVKCQQDNAFFNTMKSKYVHHQQPKSSQSIPKAVNHQKQMQELTLQNVKLYQQIQDLQEQLKKKTLQVQKYKT